MNAPFSAVPVLQRFIASALATDAAVLTALGGPGRIHPNLSPATIKTRHLTHRDYGSVKVAMPNGTIGMVSMRWAITAWEPAPSQQALEPLMEAVMGLLIGPYLAGKTHRFEDGDRIWSIEADYFGPDLVELEVAPAGTWAPLRETYTLALQQVS